MAKNPFMSAYLSGANKVANTVRAKATGEARRQAKQQSSSMMNSWFSAFTPKPARARGSASAAGERSAGPAPEPR